MKTRTHLFKKIALPSLVVLLFLIASAAGAADWICECGCDDPTCINIEGRCYKTNGEHSLNKRGVFEYDDVEDENGTITHTENGTLIDGRKKNHSWTYSSKIPPHARHYLHWNVDLEVVAIDGPNWAGVTMEGLNNGLIFRVNRYGKAQLATLRSNIRTRTVEMFTLPAEIAAKVRGEFVMTLEYDARTSVLIAKIDGTPVKRVILPYYGIPAFVSVAGFSMECVTEEHTSAGTVLFGDFDARGSNDFFPDTLL